MDLGLKDKCAIVMGASRGIGFAIADTLAREGCNVAICGRNAESLAAAQARLSEHSVKVYAAGCDVSAPDDLKAFIDSTHNELGGLDILVNNASGFGRNEDEASWRNSFDIDLMASVRACWAAIPRMEQAGGGAIVHISSISGLTAAARTPPYGAIKAALIQYTKTQALELASKKIRVNCVAPGSIYFDDGTWGKVKRSNPELYQSIMKTIPTGRYGTPEEVADQVQKLC